MYDYAVIVLGAKMRMCTIPAVAANVLREGVDEYRGIERSRGVAERVTWDISSSLQLLPSVLGAKAIQSVGKSTAHLLWEGRGW